MLILQPFTARRPEVDCWSGRQYLRRLRRDLQYHSRGGEASTGSGGPASSPSLSRGRRLAMPPPNMAFQRTRRPSLRSGRSLRSLGSPLNALPLGVG